MLATIEDLKKGDVVILAIGSSIAEAKLLRQPTLAKVGKLTTWYGKKRWASVLCSVRYETEELVSASGHKWKREFPAIAAGQVYTKEKRIDFTCKKCWIIKRENL